MKQEYAFPQSLQAGDRAQSTGGLTLRDYFAAQAMSYFLQNSVGTLEDDAKSAYAMADAMLAERAKGGEA